MQLLHARFPVLLLVACSALASIGLALASAEPVGRQVVPVRAPNADAPVGMSIHAVEPMVLWSVAAIAGASLLLSVFYLLKRRVGGFPEHPAWVAPITIMPSKNFPDEETFGSGSSGHAADTHH